MTTDKSGTQPPSRFSGGPLNQSDADKAASAEDRPSQLAQGLEEAQRRTHDTEAQPREADKTAKG